MRIKNSATDQATGTAMAEIVYDGSLRSTPDDGKPTLKGMEVVLDAVAKENPKAKGLTVQQLVDLRYLQ